MRYEPRHATFEQVMCDLYNQKGIKFRHLPKGLVFEVVEVVVIGAVIGVNHFFGSHTVGSVAPFYKIMDVV